ncbi:hypothetical protein GCM10009715_41800 [Paeniglutamicibacter psychrophenolicus]|uniref:Large polyvalent protein-associated domain-containing protein n=1 Tax=Paeniglutamicibacter psychrophenolicus TaxID=257454 RepID=A0ABS4WJV3_9MICC|nr:hypothetical protein [Paeniglutamicibacter psychrophenolicus]MBP2376482.1 hypothetical protein [Paeniglutamicibacter psychrophenolicus]
MSEEHVEDVVEGMLRQSLVAGSQLADQVVRARQQYMRNVEQRSEQAAVEAQRAFAADRAVMQSVIIPATRDDWWETARPEQITQAHLLAEAWKDHDPVALAAAEKISNEVQERYGIDTVIVQNDAAYMRNTIAVQQLNDGTLQIQPIPPNLDSQKFYTPDFTSRPSKPREVTKEAALEFVEGTAKEEQARGWAQTGIIQGLLGKDDDVDRAISEKFPDLLIANEQHRATALKVAKEHADTMALVEAAQTEHIKRYAAELKDELERHKVPSEYLASEDMVAALHASKNAAGTDSAPDADLAVAERMHLIDQDGINGPSIDDLRKEIGQNYSGAEDSLFADAEFVATARDWHEAKTLAEGGFVDQGNTGLEARYENAEKELFAWIAPLGREIQDNVLNDPNLKTPVLSEKDKEPTVPVYGSNEQYEGFKSSLEGKATQAEVKGRVAAARGQAIHPFKAVKAPEKTPTARKATAIAGKGRDKGQDGPTR